MSDGTRVLGPSAKMNMIDWATPAGLTGKLIPLTVHLSGESLWHLRTNHLWRASPMTFASNGKQYGAAVLVFGLP